MTLTAQQIDRYSRQIIVAGGIAQERLLAASLTLAGAAEDLEAVLYYFAGAGIGRIGLDLLGASVDPLIDACRRRNSDVFVGTAASIGDQPGLLLMIVGSSAGLPHFRHFQHAHCPIILVRLDTPARIAVLPSPPPCLACADVDLLAPFGRRSPEAGFVTMVAAVESLKLLMQAPLSAEAKLLTFEDYGTASVRLTPRPSSAGCPCRVASSRSP